MTLRHRYKLNSLIIINLLALFVIGNYIVWKMYTEDLLSDKNYADGDLTRIGYFVGSKLKRKNDVDLSQHHLEYKNYTGQHIDIITIGDSFSNGGGGGRNRYYQDYIATVNNKTVLNIMPYQTDPITSVSILNNNGTLDAIKPQYILIEQLEKGCLHEMIQPINFDIQLDSEKLKGQTQYYGSRPKISFVNQGNFKFLLYSLLYNFSDHAFFAKVCARKINSPLFSVTNSYTLLFDRNDIRDAELGTKQNVAKLNQNINELAVRLNSKGIKLYFMPVVEKYNLYREFIENNPYPANNFFEELRSMPRSYELIDTKTMLLEELHKGVKDIYYPDDSHWSWKASKKIFENVRFH